MSAQTPSRIEFSAAVAHHLSATGWEIDQHETGGVWTMPTAVTPSVSYPEDVRESLVGAEDVGWWFRARNKVITSVLDATVPDRSILEVGSGNGVVAAHLAGIGFDVVAVEPSRSGCDQAVVRGVHTVVSGDLGSMNLAAGTVPLVGMFDVIEHLEDDSAVLREVHRVTATGGRCVLTVPAYGWLWSQADETAGHYRRHSKTTLDRTMRAVGFRPVFRSYFFSVATLPAFLVRTVPYRLGRRESAADAESRSVRELSQKSTVGELAARVEARRLSARRPLPFGTSIIGVYQRV